jgi:hypothetical protein
VRWARQDLELRQNFSTQAALAWALYRNSHFAEALTAMRQALSSDVRDAKLFFRPQWFIWLPAGPTRAHSFCEKQPRSIRTIRRSTYITEFNMFHRHSFFQGCLAGRRGRRQRSSRTDAVAVLLSATQTGKGTSSAWATCS